MTRKERDAQYADFRTYLRNCTDKQIQGVYDKERAAGRTGYARLAVQEAERRSIELRKQP